MKYIFLEAGSGAKIHADPDLVKLVAEQLEIPVITGGGIRTPKSAEAIARAGAGFIVFGTTLEDQVKENAGSESGISSASALTSAVHYLEN